MSLLNLLEEEEIAKRKIGHRSTSTVVLRMSRTITLYIPKLIKNQKDSTHLDSDLTLSVYQLCVDELLLYLLDLWVVELPSYQTLQ